ncbi:U9-ctenitoxin-Pr1a-like [Rhopilema esculentum]|uniref:U9-ctenitoxin-Pr1a-like n=1 Tax=Rhopilema esculentum TaxID=499914 RepID=UPI0031DEC3D4
MKSIVFLFAILAVAMAMEKRHLFEKCAANADCGEGRCCINMKVHKFCADQLDEGALCTIRSKLSCGCKKDLVCKGNFFLKRCVKDDSGSGDFY